MWLAILCFAVVFTFIASGGMLVFYRQALLQRVSDVVTREPKRGWLRGAAQQSRLTVRGLVPRLGRMVPKNATKNEQLAQAGYRNESALGVFYGVSLLASIGLVLLASFIGSVGAVISALGLGLVLPNFFLKRMIKVRQKRISKGLPDALDFLVICIEAGLGIDQATARTAADLKLAHPALSEELSFLVLEQRAGRPRSDAWRLFADRTGLDAVKILARALVQAEQFGTGIARTLRIHSESMRKERRQTIEERAAKTSVKMIFPLAIFIFPSLFLVTLGPAVITMSEAFETYFPH